MSTAVTPRTPAEPMSGDLKMSRTNGRHDHHERHEAGPEAGHGAAASSHPVGQVDDEGELRQLARLDGRQPRELEPLRGAAHRHLEGVDLDQDEEHARDQHQRQGGQAQPAVVHPHRDQHEDEPHGRPHAAAGRACGRCRRRPTGSRPSPTTSRPPAARAPSGRGWRARSRRPVPRGARRRRVPRSGRPRPGRRPASAAPGRPGRAARRTLRALRPAPGRGDGTARRWRVRSGGPIVTSSWRTRPGPRRAPPRRP